LVLPEKPRLVNNIGPQLPWFLKVGQTDSFHLNISRDSAIVPQLVDDVGFVMIERSAIQPWFPIGHVADHRNAID
jgi:hypothetical protein